MSTKYGTVTSIGRKGRRFTEAMLSSGERVELSAAAMGELFDRVPHEALVFVERRGLMFSYVQWIGTPEEALAALDKGLLKSHEIPWQVQWAGEAMRRIRDGTSAIRLAEPPPTDINWDAGTIAALNQLASATPRTWAALAQHHAEVSHDAASRARLQELISRAGARALTASTREQDVRLAKEVAERSAQGATLLVAELPGSASVTEKMLRAAANAVATLAMLLPYFHADEVDELWRLNEAVMRAATGRR